MRFKAPLKRNLLWRLPRFPGAHDVAAPQKLPAHEEPHPTLWTSSHIPQAYSSCWGRGAGHPQTCSQPAMKSQERLQQPPPPRSQGGASGPWGRVQSSCAPAVWAAPQLARAGEGHGFHTESSHEPLLRSEGGLGSEGATAKLRRSRQLLSRPYTPEVPEDLPDHPSLGPRSPQPLSQGGPYTEPHPDAATGDPRCSATPDHAGPARQGHCSQGGSLSNQKGHIREKHGCPWSKGFQLCL